MKISAETQPQNDSVLLDRFERTPIGKPICFDCRRLRRTA